jgi:hypothetical protein
MQKMFLRIILCAALCIPAACDNEGGFERPRGRLYVQENGDAIEVRGPDGSILIRGNQETASIMIRPEDSAEGALDYASGSFVPDFPADIPILPGSTVVMNQVLKGTRNAIATLSTQESADTVIAFYEEQIPLKGWEPGARFDLDNIVMLNGTRGNTSLNISITDESNTVTINMARTESTK